MVNVDVVVFSHNHREFVGDALRGVFAQETSATVRVRIHDDASTDGTADMIRKIMLDCPFDWELKVAETNQYQFGSSFKYYFAVNTDADYVAFLDADDYWTHPGKLDAQIRLLNRLPQVSICHTAFRVLGKAGETHVLRPSGVYRAEIVPGHFLATPNFVGTLTVVVRRTSMPDKLPSGFDRLRGVDDYPIWALVSDGLFIGYLDTVTATYRIHGTNNFAGQEKEVQRRQTLDAMVWIANAVEPIRIGYWLDGITEFLKDPSFPTRVSLKLRQTAGLALRGLLPSRRSR